MKIRFQILPAALWLLWCCQCAAAELVFGFYSAPPALFTTEEMAARPGSGQGEVSAVLKKRGLDMPDGSTACYDAASALIFLRSTPGDLKKFTRMLGDRAAAGAEAQVKQVQVTAVCYAIPVSAVPSEFGPQSSVKLLPRDKLAVMDRASLICRSGQRSKTESKRDAPPKRAGSDQSPVAERSFEIETTVGEDGVVIDLNMAWELRTAKLAPEGQTGEFKVATQILSSHGGSVMQELGTTAEAEPRLVFLVLDFAILPPVVTK